MAELESMVERTSPPYKRWDILPLMEWLTLILSIQISKRLLEEVPSLENIPTIGDVRFTEEDVDKLYRYIK